LDAQAMDSVGDEDEGVAVPCMEVKWKAGCRENAELE